MQYIKSSVLLATLALGLSATAQAIQFHAIDLGTLNGGPNSLPTAIGNGGHVVGRSRGLGATVTQSFINDGSMHHIGTLGRGTFVTDVNGSGQATGYSSLSEGGVRAYVYNHATGTMSALGTFGGNHSNGWGINEAGYVVGESNFVEDIQAPHAFMFDGTTMHDLGTLGGSNSVAYGINDSNIVVGKSSIGGPGIGTQHAFLYDGTMHDLGTMGGIASEARKINNLGQVLGRYQKADQSWHDFMYHNGVMQDLGTYLGLSTPAFGAALNNKGQMLLGVPGMGPSYYDGTTLYKLSDLLINVPAGVQIGIVDINDNGQIAAVGTFADGTQHAFLLNPVPIPASAWMFGAALMSLVAGRMRRIRR
jgi:probable HAF family extracellular repeat protein